MVALAVVMLPLGVLSYLSSQVLHGMAYWMVGFALTVVSLCVTIFVLHRKTHLISGFKKKLVNLFG